MFGAALHNLSSNLSALRDFVDLVAPVLADKQTATIREHTTMLAPVLLAIHEVSPEKYALGDDLKARLASDAENAGLEIVRSSPERPDSISIRCAKPETAPLLTTAVDRLIGSLKQKELLYGSALISLVSSAEWFLAQLLHIYFNRHEGALGDEKVFSLADLKTYTTVEDARRHLIERRVEDILRGSLEDWIQFLRSHTKLSMSYLEPDLEALVEVFQRRNILVHNGGMASGRYLEKTPPRLREGLRIGEQIHVGRDYMESSIAKLERAFLLIGFELWKKLAPDDAERGEVLIALTFAQLVAERWGIAEGLSIFAVSDKHLSESDRLIEQVNLWQSVKWQGRFDEISADVEAIDFSAKDDKFRLAKMAVLGDADAFFALLPKVLKAEKLTSGAVRTWPLFREMREDPRFAPLLESEAPLHTSGTGDDSGDHP